MGTLAERVIAETVERLGYELIEAEFVKARALWRVFIDRPESTTGQTLVGIDDCARVTEHLLDALEAAAVPYEHLEVSTPGMDRALTKAEHYQRFAGQMVRLSFERPFEGRRHLTGYLLGLDGDMIRVRTDERGEQEQRIPLACVRRARIVPQFEEF
ncbi:MAG: ribosome maturation factor RimP [Casimicrobiaceae bacterium]|nr:ribosome maturation factor RimP [Casimicrobiaceae bacterium]MDW8312987.1 ribosome maturation factor RimP [Burkholderiales bacterium]